VRLTVIAALFVALVLSMLALKSQQLAANVSVESGNLGGSSFGNVSR
jgi:hypothetical protein